MIENEISKFMDIVYLWLDWLNAQNAYTLLIIAFLAFFVSLWIVSRKGESIQ